MRVLCRKFLLIIVLYGFTFLGHAQRPYKPHSVLSTGNWYKIAITSEGVYKIDLSFLAGLGLTGNIPSSQIRLFGNQGGMLSEANNQTYIDDLEEIALSVVDGGDGILNGTDFILFYATGPHQWIKDSANKRFSHLKNLYSEKAFFYLNIGGSGKRIQVQTVFPSATSIITSFDERHFHEIDSVNFLSSGKQWYGEELSNLPGHSLTRQFSVPAFSIAQNQPFTIISNVAARSVNVSSQFNIFLNGVAVQQLNVPVIGGGLYDLFAQQSQQISTATLAGNTINLTYRYVPGSFNSQGWINWFEVFYRRQLNLPANGQLLFRDWNSVGNSSAEFRITGADNNTQVWDVSTPLEPVKMNTVIIGGEIKFSNDAQTLHEYISFSNSFLTPQPMGKIPNQDLHNTVETDYFIISHPAFLVQAQRLARFHEQRNALRTIVITTDQVYNEFSSGIPDPTAIRDFIKMFYDKYRATWTQKGKYLALFGKSSFDYKDLLKNNTGFVPGYQSVSSLNPLSTYTSDDFFGFLDDSEDINSSLIINQLDIGIGRIPVKNIDEAKNFVDKVEAYHNAASLGPWRNNLNFIADDEDFNLHLQDAEVITNTSLSTAPSFNLQKVYLDAFRQEGGSAGGRYPQANEVINNNIFNGTLIWNYSGHGGPQRLAEEVVIDQQIVNNWNNANRLPLFITATCDFAPYDNPTANSLGENLLLRPKTGAIALMTTTRVVFAFSNRIMNNNYLQFALQADSSGRYKTLGEAVLSAKNYTYQTSGDVVNNRKFALLGDPAMTLGFPQLKVKPLTVNGKNFSAGSDTLRATEFVKIEGEVSDNTGNRINNFNGTVYLSLFDKPQSISTLANDPTSQPVSFQTQTATLFKGKVTATNGAFTFNFKLPKDINFQYGPGKLSFYAEDGVKDGAGFSKDVIIGGISSGNTSDKEGPIIKAYLNDERFVNGSITSHNPVLIVKLSDSSGINTGSSGIDHDIVATLDGDNRKYFVLNDFYETDLDSYQQGSLRFQLPELLPGKHFIKVKAWDIMNNSSEYMLEFTITNTDEIILDHVLNYPNPFTTSTAFWFEHNQPATDLQVRIEIFSIGGRIIKTLQKTINTEGTRSNDIDWDGRDEYGDKIGRGVYLYRLTVQRMDGKKASKIQRLLVIR
ncbi:MAG: type IX secretion system sortase PorU [Bacteroidota bacterium]|nr:type IX secretion system sortase PorU [Bacteroidota bacterium]